MSESWIDNDDGERFMKYMSLRRNSALDLLVNTAAESSDPNIRSAWAALAQITQTIQDLEDERGNDK